MLPASALRGALRETAERLLRGIGEAACSGGDGIDPRSGSDKPAEPCELGRDGRPCRACLLFGTQGGGGPPALSLSAATTVGEAPAFTVRNGVAIERESRSAKEKRLYSWWVPAPSRSRSFRAQGSLVSGTDEEALWTLLQAAVRGTTHVGRSRSRGLGRVDLQVVTTESSPFNRHVKSEADDAPGLRLLMRLDTPACISPALPSPTVLDTVEWIPGSTFRGALGTALADVEPAVAESDAFRALFDEDTGAVFDFFYPVIDLRAAEPAAPWPLTARRCKYDSAHPTVDTLLDRIVVESMLAGHTPITAKSGAKLLERCDAAGCGSPLDSPSGLRRHADVVPTRSVTRVSLERTTSAAREGMLYTSVLLEEGTYFEGSIRRVPAQARQLLCAGVELPLSVGRGRSRGWGRISIQGVSPYVDSESVRTRAERFDDALRARLADAQLPLERVGRLLPLTLLSPLLLDNGDDGCGALALALGHSGLAWVTIARRFGVQAGWDQRPGQRKALAAVHSVEAGSVFVADLGEGQDWRQIVAGLERLETDGAGARCYQGFGRILCFDPMILKREFCDGNDG